MDVVARFAGPGGEIELIRSRLDGTLAYYEDGILQSQGTSAGESVFTYVKLMVELLHRPSRILVLGCGAGNLASELDRRGKVVTVVDTNPLSFMIARRYFTLPARVRCVTADFRSVIGREEEIYEGIAIDVAAPGFSTRRTFTEEICDTLRSRLAPGGRIVMNLTIDNDLDPTPDRIAAMLSGRTLHPWIVDERGVEGRNAVLACTPERLASRRSAFTALLRNHGEEWLVRKGRLGGAGRVHSVQKCSFTVRKHENSDER